MAEWWNSLSNFEQVYWGIAALSTLLFVIIIVFTFLGGDAEDATDIDFDEGAFHFFTFRNLVGFFTVFSWSGIACLHSGLSTTLTIVISVVCGLAMMFAMAGLFYMMSRMTQTGTLRLTNAIGGVGEVYLRIGPARSSVGKVQIKVQGTLREIDALTDESEELLFGQVVRVKSLINDQLLLVEKLTS